VTPARLGPAHRAYRVREDGDPVEFARSVRARTEYQAAEDYVAEMYDSGIVPAALGASRTVIVTAQNGRDVRYTVTTEWVPKFVAVAE
jgi:hypothetical protein